MLLLPRGQALRFPAVVGRGDQLLIPVGVGELALIQRLGREAEAVGEQGNGQLRMVGRAVIALAVILHRDLPVAVLDQVNGLDDLGVGQVVGGQIRRHLGGEVCDVAWRIVREADEQKPRHGADVDRLEALAALVEFLAHVVGEDQVPVQIVGPGVVAADEIADDGSGLIHQPGAAVAADVMEGLDGHVVVADDQHRPGADVDRDHVARLRHVRLDRDIDPVLAEDGLEVLLEDVRAGVEVPLQPVAGAAPCDQIRERRGGGLSHVASP